MAPYFKRFNSALKSPPGDPILCIPPSNRVPFIPVVCYPCNSVNFAVYLLEEYDPARCAAIIKNARKHTKTDLCTKLDHNPSNDFYHHFYTPYQSSETALHLYQSHKDIRDAVVAKNKADVSERVLYKIWEDIRTNWYQKLVDGLSRKRKVEDSSDIDTLDDDCIHFKLLTTPTIISPSK